MLSGAGSRSNRWMLEERGVAPLVTERRVGRLDELSCAVLVIGAFALVYICSLSLVYVEGDDATIVAYHALGRNNDLQPFYSPYQSLLDLLLGVLPPREEIVRQSAMILTAVSAPIFFYFMMSLAFDWCSEARRAPKWLLGAVMLLTVPEFFYLGMVLTPSLIAMALLLGAHLVIRRATAIGPSPKWHQFASSALLFAVGAGFRWDTIVYGGTIATDLFFRAGDQSERPPGAIQRMRLAVTWGALAGLTWLAVVNFTGWSIESIVHTMLSQGPVESFDWKLGLARAQTFFTPALLVLGGIGVYTLVREKHCLPVIALLAILPVAPLISYGVPKWFITAIPSLFACAVAGVYRLSPRSRLWGGIVTLAALPWFVGVQWSYGETAWGPAFELRPYYRVQDGSSAPALTLGSGMAIPTPEGPRPLFGHAWVLFGGWKPFVNEYSGEQQAAVLAAVESRLPLLLDEQGQGWFAAILAAEGYSTKDSASPTNEQNSMLERHWSRSDGARIRIVQFVNPDDLFSAAAVDGLRAVTGDSVIISGFSRNMLRLQKISSESLYPLGKRTALLNLHGLSAKLPRY